MTKQKGKGQNDENMDGAMIFMTTCIQQTLLDV
jgi:hypothetical protein